MKKLLILLISISVSFACFCVSDINQGFNTLKKIIVNGMLEPQKDNVNNLKDSIDKNTKAIKSENEELKKLIEIEKQKAIQYSEMVFLFEKRKEMLK